MRIAILSLSLVISLTGQAQSVNQLFEESTKAYQNKNMPLFLSLCQTQDSIRPSHPKILYNLACAYALNNRPQDAIATLTKLVLMNNATSFENDEDFVSLRSLTAYKELITLKSKLSQPVKNSKKIIELSEKNLHPEGIVYLPEQQLWLAGSVHQHKIVSFDVKTGACKDWLTDSNMLSVFSMKSDGQYLWVATSAIPEMENYTPDIKGKGEILKIDINKKTIIQRYTLDNGHVFGDIIISKDKDVFISDSEQPVIYSISHTDNQLLPWLNLKGEVYNLQGLTFNEDETKIFIADYLKGIVKIDVNHTANRTWLKFPDDVTSKGIDGIVYYENSLIAIHNGVNPIRIMNYVLNKEENKILQSTIIDMAREEFKEPTLGYVVGNQLYFIANSPWSIYVKDNILDDKKLKAPLLFSYKLSR